MAQFIHALFNFNMHIPAYAGWLNVNVTLLSRIATKLLSKYFLVSFWQPF